ncbi:hypothetical protein BON22_3778 [Cyberlindnera fabianii]|uniref:Uncharacterized protein n=1 Tax=Cyberlindnera fabianii TaxID=36022 RepID=A0A1V2L332_CYBFA|nr:hypothetical protein BON22_3778 [Cyberlindnera fabianii]
MKREMKRGAPLIRKTDARDPREEQISERLLKDISGEISYSSARLMLKLRELTETGWLRRLWAHKCLKGVLTEWLKLILETLLVIGGILEETESVDVPELRLQHLDFGLMDVKITNLDYRGRNVMRRMIE